MKDKQIAFYIMDAENGELVNEVYYNDKLSIAREQQLKYLNSTTPLNNKKGFTKCFNLPLRELSALKLSGTAWSILAFMISHLGWGGYSGYVIKTQNNKFFDYIVCKDVIKVVNCNEETFSKIIRKLENEEILKTQKKGREQIFIINPFIITKDKRIPKTLFKLFENTKYNYLGEHLPLQNSIKLHNKVEHTI